VGFVLDKMALGQVSPSTSVSPATLHSTNCSTITLIYHLGLYNRPEVAAVPGDVCPTPQKKKERLTEPAVFLPRPQLLYANTKVVYKYIMGTQPSTSSCAKQETFCASNLAMK
jgi:hypothetical protein